MLREQLTLIDASKVFMRMNSVYKQASIERHQIKKKNVVAKEASGGSGSQAKEGGIVSMLDNNLMKGKNLEILFMQQQRLGRLHANSSFA